ncbi:MAG: hypothetical protein Kow0042_23590 [Calditrichia bacterium]
MSTYVLMKILEHIPSQYERGIRRLSRGRLESAYERLVSRVSQGQRVLDLGCGTGALSLRAAARTARVKAIDINPGMLEMARQRAGELGLQSRIEFAEMGTAELDREEGGSFDVVMNGLSLSELSPQELHLLIPQVFRLLRPGGLWLIADETLPATFWKRLVFKLLRFPFKVITWLMTTSTTRPLKDFPRQLQQHGFQIVDIQINRLQSFCEIVARKPEEPT